MKRYLAIFAISILLVSCKAGPNADRQYTAEDDKNTYKLGLNPEPGKTYTYNITNESDVKMKAGDKNVGSRNKSEVVISYSLNKDSAENFLLSMKYGSIKVHFKNDDTETDLSSESTDTLDVLDKMIVSLKGTEFQALISPIGEVKSLKGYDELVDKVVGGFSNSDPEVARIARHQFEQALGEGLIRKNMDQILYLFPDSAVHVGDKWKVNSKQGGQLPFTISSFLKLKNINDQEAVIAADGRIYSSSDSSDLSGNTLRANMTGSQDARYRIERKTGMLYAGESDSEMEGTLMVMGHEIPVTIKSTVRIKRENR